VSVKNVTSGAPGSVRGRGRRRPCRAEVEGITIHAVRKAVARYRAGRILVPKTAGLAPKTVKNVATDLGHPCPTRSAGSRLAVLDATGEVFDCGKGDIRPVAEDGVTRTG
jgi:hypothetical protein